jgi:hypothetical protein
MSITLSLSSTHMPDDSLQQLTYAICADLRSEFDEHATLMEHPSTSKNDKGDAISVGTIVMSLIGTGGVAVALVNVLRSYIERGQHLSIKVKSKRGDEVELTADNLKPDQLKETTALVSQLLGAS